MKIFEIIVILVIFILGLILLAFLQKKHISYSKRVFLGLMMGIIFGGVLQLIFGNHSEVLKSSVEGIDIVGDSFIALLQMLVIPLVFISIVHSFTNMAVVNKFAKIAKNVLGILLGMVSLSAVIAYLSTLLFRLNGAKFSVTLNKDKFDSILTAQHANSSGGLAQHIVSFIPKNVFADFAGTRSTSTVGVVIFAAFVGIAFLGVKRKHEKDAKVFAELTESIYKIVMRITTLVLRLTPFGIFALMTSLLTSSDFSSIVNLGRFIITIYFALIIVLIMHMLIVGLRVHISPLTYLKKAWAPLSLAFTSRSSAGVLPLNVEAQVRAFGVDETTANFAASFAMSIGQNGCAGVYPAMLATIVAPTAGVNIFSIQYLLSLVVIIAVSSLGVAGVGGGGTFAALIVFGSLNLPVTIIGLMIGIEPLIDMGRTLVNVSGGMVAGIVTSKNIGDLNEKILSSKDFNLEIEEQ